MNCELQNRFIVITISYVPAHTLIRYIGRKTKKQKQIGTQRVKCTHLYDPTKKKREAMMILTSSRRKSFDARSLTSPHNSTILRKFCLVLSAFAT